MGLITKTETFASIPGIDPDIGAELDTCIARLYTLVNGSLDNANIGSTPKIDGSKVDNTSEGFVLTAGDEVTGIIEHIFDAVSTQNVWTIGRASGNARVYTGIGNALYTVSYNTSYTGAAWAGRDVSGICSRLELGVDGFYVYHAVTAGSGVTPVWVLIFHIDSSGEFQARTTPELSPYVVGDVIIAESDETGTFFSDGNADTAKEIILSKNGALRIKFDAKCSAVCVSGVAYIRRNDVQVGTSRDVTSSWVTYSEDLSGWSRGDTCQLYVAPESGETILIRNFRLSCDVEHNDVWTFRGL